MNARGTRRPHPRRVRHKKVKISSGGPGKGAGCVVLVLAFLASPLAAAAGLWLMTRS